MGCLHCVAGTVVVGVNADVSSFTIMKIESLHRWLIISKEYQSRTLDKKLKCKDLQSQFPCSYSPHCVKSVHIRSYSGPYFPAVGLNTEKYPVSLRIQSDCGKMRTRTTKIAFFAVAARKRKFQVNLSFEKKEHNMQTVHDTSKVTSKVNQTTLTLFSFKLALHFDSTATIKHGYIYISMH